MDPLSIATAAVGLSGTCITVAKAIYQYIEDVKDVDKGLPLLGQELTTLSRSLDNVQDALRKHEHFLSNNLGDSVNLFKSLSICIQDCDATIKHIGKILADGQSHGRVGQAMSRVATHWKLKDKERELSLLRSRIISFHTTMDMTLKMIHMCLFLQAQEGNVKKQNRVLNQLNQLRRDIEQLTKMSESQRGKDAESVPATGHGGPSNTNNPRTVLGRGIPQGANSSKVLQPHSVLGIPHATQSAEPKFSPVETQHMRDIQLARSLLEGEHTERAKSLCRKVIHATDSNVGNMHAIHKDALQTLAYIYERTGDHKEAAQIRLLQDMQGRNTIRQGFKTLVQRQEFQKGINYAYKWAILLQDNAALHAYGPYLDGLRMDSKSSSSVLFTAVCVMGNTLLAQPLLSQGASIHGQVYTTLYGKRRALSPFGCAINFGHCHLVRDLLEAASEGLDSFVNSNHFDIAINAWNIEICRVFLDHVLFLYKGTAMRQVNFNEETAFSTESEKLQVGALLERKSAASNGSGGPWKALLNALHKAISRRDLAMTKLLLSYGIKIPDPLKLMTRMQWLEGVQAIATHANDVSEEDIAYAFQSRELDICNYLLSLNPKSANSVINYAMEGAGLEGLQMVIKFGANVNHPVYWGSAEHMGPIYPLHFAVHVGSLEMVKALLAAGADVRNQDEIGQTALQFATKKGQRRDLQGKEASDTTGIVALLKGIEPRKANSGATTSTGGYSKGSSLRSWWYSSKRHQVAATVGN